MTSKGKFYLLKEFVIIKSKEYKNSCEFHNLIKHEHISIQDCIDDIEKDLDRLEKYDKAKEIIKEKHVNVWVDINCSDNYKHYYNYAIKHLFNHVLTEEEFNMLKEIFG